mmetsp:Transcript_29594/g.95419  ORF Transcript_29594/g.95419 Transcript_29594/m.95419 type:complete len:135 (+) Transcript_29594:1163-1567(+)
MAFKHAYDVDATRDLLKQLVRLLDSSSGLTPEDFPSSQRRIAQRAVEFNTSSLVVDFNTAYGTDYARDFHVAFGHEQCGGAGITDGASGPAVLPKCEARFFMASLDSSFAAVRHFTTRQPPRRCPSSPSLRGRS